MTKSLVILRKKRFKRSLIRKALNRLPEFSTTIGSPIYFIILLCKSYFSQFLTYSESFLLFVFYFHRKLRNVFSGIEIEELLLFSLTYQQATSVVKICLLARIVVIWVCSSWKTIWQISFNKRLHQGFYRPLYLY